MNELKKTKRRNKKKSIIKELWGMWRRLHWMVLEFLFFVSVIFSRFWNVIYDEEV